MVECLTGVVPKIVLSYDEGIDTRGNGIDGTVVGGGFLAVEEKRTIVLTKVT